MGIENGGNLNQVEEAEEVAEVSGVGQEVIPEKMEGSSEVAKESDPGLGAQEQKVEQEVTPESSPQLLQIGPDFDENLKYYNDQDKAIRRLGLERSYINELKTELQKALESGQIAFSNGELRRLDIPEEQKEIKKKLQTVESTIQALIQSNTKITEDMRYTISSEASWVLKDENFKSMDERITSFIDSIKNSKRFKLLGMRQEEIQALESLRESIKAEFNEYKQLQKSERDIVDRDIIIKFQQLPKSIQQSIYSLEDPKAEDINEVIEAISIYQTPQELIDKREEKRVQEAAMKGGPLWFGVGEPGADQHETIENTEIPKVTPEVVRPEDNSPVDATIQESETRVHSIEVAQNSSIREFSKKYSPINRRELASRIRMLRMKHHAGQKPKPSWIEEGKIGIEESELKKNEGNIVQIQEQLTKMTAELNTIKAETWSRLKDYFTGDSKKIRKAIDDLVATKKQLEEDAQKRIELISQMRKQIDDATYLQQSKKLLDEFYEDQGTKKEIFDQQERDRDIQNIFDKYGFVFVHAMAPKASIMAYNAVTPETYESLDTRLDIIAGYQPTLATSGFHIENGRLNTENGMLAPTFIIFKGGKLLDVSQQDIGSYPEGLYSRVPRTDKSLGILRDDMPRHIDETLSQINAGDVNLYPEAIIENPEIGALGYSADTEPELTREEAHQKFIQAGKTEEDWQAFSGDWLFKDDVELLAKKAEEYGVPLVRISKNGTSEINMQQFFGKPDISKQERLNLATKALENKPFQIKSLNKRKFDAVSDWINYKYINEDKYMMRHRLQNIKDEINELTNKINYLKDQILGSPPTANVEDFIRYLDGDRNKLAILPYDLYGILLASEKYHDEDIVALAKAALLEIPLNTPQTDSIHFLESWYGNSIDQNGQYKIQESDIPREVRQRLKMLNENT